MKHFIFLSLAVLVVNALIMEAQTPEWKWAVSAVGTQYDQASAIATDAEGNIVVAGYFASDSLSFGNKVVHNKSLGSADVFLAKYDASGTIVWARSFGGSGDDKAFAVATDRNGNVYVTGNFYSPTLEIGSYSFTNAGTVGDIFTVKYSTQGDLLWAKSEGGAGLEMPFAIAVDGAENVVVTGRFSSNSITFGTFTLKLVGSMDVFLVKYNAAGSVVWAKGVGSGSNDESYAVDIDNAGNILVAGYFNQNILFGKTTLTTSGISDMFLAKFDSLGSVMWARKAGGKGDDRATAVAVDADGNSYITGHYAGDSLHIGSLVLPYEARDNTVIAKYDPDGNLVWAHNVAAASTSLALCLYANNVYVCGVFRGDTLTYASSTLLRRGTNDLFLLNCSTAGEKRWAKQQSAGGESNETATCIASDSRGSVVVGGYFDSSPLVLGSTSLNATGKRSDMFIAHLGTTTSAVPEVQDQNDLMPFPQPARTSLSLQSLSPLRSYVVYSMMGEELMRNDNIESGHTHSLNLTQLCPGLYLIKIVSEDNDLLKTFIIE